MIVVVGTGLAGLVAAVRLAEGRRARARARQGRRRDAPGPGDDRRARATPLNGSSGPREALAASRADHPYSLVGRDGVAAAIAWSERRRCRTSGGLDENLLLPTAVGALKPSALVPETMAAGDLRS